MGSEKKPEWSYIDELPQHLVTNTHGFWMFDTPCTQQLWEAAGLRNESNFKGGLRPAENLSFEQAAEFVQLVNRQVAGLELRLPTEAEWEYSCRAGTDSDRYGNLDEIAWYDKNCGGKTHEVKLKHANAWGLYDMLGNVWEWCLDGPRHYSAQPLVDPAGEALLRRVVRGGSWDSSAGGVRGAIRDALDPGCWFVHLGFRCLSSPEPSPVQGREAAMSESLRGGSPQDRERELPPRGKKDK